jgi:hypothetical protein
MNARPIAINVDFINFIPPLLLNGAILGGYPSLMHTSSEKSGLID